jgi:hypothetical protein
VLQWFKDQVHQAGGGSYQRLSNQALLEHIARHDEPLEETCAAFYAKSSSTLDEALSYNRPSLSRTS